MLIREILSEGSYEKKLKSYVLDYIISARGNKLKKINLEKFVNELQREGLDINKEYIKTLLGKKPYIDMSTVEDKGYFILNPDDDTIEHEEAEEEKDDEVETTDDEDEVNVDDMAKEKAKKDIIG